MKKSSSKRMQTVELDLEKTIPEDVQVKLCYLCKKRRLPYPDGILVLLKEVSKPSAKPRRRKTDSSSCSRTLAVSSPDRCRATGEFSRPKKVR